MSIQIKQMDFYNLKNQLDSAKYILIRQNIILTKMSQYSSSRQTSSFQVKRQQFHTSIRRQQLDQYRQRRRQQLFGHMSRHQISSSTQNSHDISSPHNNGLSSSEQKNRNQQPFKMEMGKINQSLTEQLRQKLTFSPYPFNEPFQQFIISEFHTKLLSTNYNLQAIGEVVNILVKSELALLASNENYEQNILPQLLKLIAKMLKKVNQIPKMSQIRKNSHLLIQDIYRKIAFSVKFIILGMINQQNYQISQIEVISFRKTAFCKIIKNKQRQPNGMSLQGVQEQINQMEQNLSTFKHPLELCNFQVKQILIQFFEVYRQSQQSTDQSENRDNQHLSLIYLDYFVVLSYLVSFFKSTLFTGEFFRLYIDHMDKVPEIRVDSLDMLIQTISNFMFCQTYDNSSSKNITQKSHEKISYSNQLIGRAIKIFQFCLQNFEISTSSVNALVKSLLHSFQIRRRSFIPFFVNNRVIELLIELLMNQKQAMIYIEKKWQNGQVTKEQFINKFQQTSVNAEGKKQIYQLLGAIFSYINTPKEIKFLNEFIPYIQDLVYYEFKRLFKSNQKMITNEIQKMQLTSQQQNIVESVLFMLANMIGFSVELVKIFIQKNILMHLLNIWNYFHHIELNISNPNSDLYNFSKCKQMYRVKSIITDSIYNIVVMLTDDRFQSSEYFEQTENSSHKRIQSQLTNVQSLEIIVEYNNCGTLKLLIHFLKSSVYELDPALADKEAVKYALQGLNRLLEFIILRQKGRILLEGLSNSSEFSLRMLKEVLNIIMISSNTYDQKTTEIACMCLERFDIIIKDCGVNQYQELQNQWDYEEEKNSLSQRETTNTQKHQHEDKQVDI